MEIQRVINFINELSKNNNKIWFDNNKKEYIAVKKIIEEFTLKLIEEISKFDNSIKYLTAQNCTYRINRDLRFSKDKIPYKTHIGIFICPRGKKSPYAGYYFHLEANYSNSSNFLGRNEIDSGVYCPDKKILNGIRTAIVNEPIKFIEAINKAIKTRGFYLSEYNSLKKVPNGFPKDTNYSNYLKLKNYCLTKPLSDEIIFSKDIIDITVDNFKQTFDFITFLNKSIEFTIKKEKEIYF